MHHCRRFLLGSALLLAFGLPLSAADESAKPAGDFVDDVEGPLSPEEALEHFQLAPGLRIELVAAEPLVVDPVAIRFDERGRMWVVELRDYPNGPSGEADEPAKNVKGRSRIRVLEDRDGDGRFEHATTFADELLFATGVQPWKGGAIVTLAGEVAYMKDTDGDGRADLREWWYRGFAEENPQLRANHPTLALDNHVYVANGLRGGTIVANEDVWGREWPPVKLLKKDFRFDPHTGEMEAVSGNGQFGLAFDDFGNRFVCSNRHPCQHVVLEDRYLERNPYLVVESVVENVSPPAERSRVYPISQSWTTSNLHAGQFTAACGLTIYRGNALPAAFRGNAFVCEPTGNLVHRDVLTPKGVTFTARPGREGVEFLASPDEWFRPVNLANGPDGALYVVDMYRAVIEHPHWMPEELKRRPDLQAGNDRGRIWRIVPEEWERPEEAGLPGELWKVSTPDLVELLGHDNAWHRETAARLILEKRDRKVVPDVRRAATKAPTHGRIAALWLLEGLSEFDDRALEDALEGESALKVQALRIVERHPDIHGRSRTAFSRARTDKDASVVFQWALSAGRLDRHESLPVSADPMLRLAGFSGLAPDHAAVFARTIGNGQFLELGVLDSKWTAILPSLSDAAEMIGRRGDVDDARQVLDSLSELLSKAGQRRSGVWLRSPHLAIGTSMLGLGRGLRQSGKPMRPLLSKIGSDDADIAELRSWMAEMATVIDESDPAPSEFAIELLAYVGTPETDKRLVASALEADVETRIHIIETLTGVADESLTNAFLPRLRSETPAVREAILNVFLRTSDGTNRLLDAIASKELAVAELDATHVRRLTTHRDAGIRERAKELLAAAIPQDRQVVLEKYQPALKLDGDPERGRVVFEKNCATCHRVAGIGVNVGPDVSDTRTKTPEYLLTAILQPNKAIDADYLSYTVVTTEGLVHSGLIAGDAGGAIVLRQPQGKTVSILRDDVETLKSNGISLMPDGLEKNVDVEAMADLIAFLKSWRYLDGRVPVGESE